jgi:hypothetical protein
MMWVDKSDEVIWTFALRIYLERAVLVCWQFMGFLYFEILFHSLICIPFFHWSGRLSTLLRTL